MKENNFKVGDFVMSTKSKYSFDPVMGVITKLCYSICIIKIMKAGNISPYKNLEEINEVDFCYYYEELAKPTTIEMEELKKTIEYGKKKNNNRI